MTVPEVAERLRLKPETVRRWIRRGKLRAISFGSDRAGLRVRRSEVERFVGERESGLAQLELPPAEDVRTKKLAA